MSRRYRVHADLAAAIARGDADQTRRLIAGHSLLTASDADRCRLPGGRGAAAGPGLRAGSRKPQSVLQKRFSVSFSGTGGGACPGGQSPYRPRRLLYTVTTPTGPVARMVI